MCVTWKPVGMVDMNMGPSCRYAMFRSNVYELHVPIGSAASHVPGCWLELEK